jgi:hypothetical protein
MHDRPPATATFERVVRELAAGCEDRLTGDGDLNAAFLVLLSGRDHPAYERAASMLRAAQADDDRRDQAAFYRAALTSIRDEVEAVVATDPEVARAANELVAAIQAGGQPEPERWWQLFFPEGVGIAGHEQARLAELRDRRTIRLDRLNERPIERPTTELLLTANVLLTVPAEGTDHGALPYDDGLRAALATARQQDQLYWYDHPIQIGVEPAANELLYGLRAMDAAMAVERRRDPTLGRLTVVLSASVTHAGLRVLARDYVRHELAREGRLENLSVHLFTEDDTRALVEQVLAPLAERAGRSDVDGDALLEVFGVDGEYGRHYSFLKAVAALWQVVVEPRLRATFKFDLDQVFPQPELVGQTGRSALEHLRSPLWGATGRDHWGDPVELGMIAGALVNERDIGSGLFSPDVSYPGAPGQPDELVFFSRLPQALSTRAEMMERHDGPPRDGRHAALERVHVTGGTNGILINALRRHRPFVPTFIGRAEDQAYLLSTLDGWAPGDMARSSEPRLAYAHQAGLFMRHDKESFAGPAIEAARAGKLIGDDVRILYFSAYAELLGRTAVKQLIDPFTGCFVSRLPRTVALLRSALRADAAIAGGNARLGQDLLAVGPRRIAQALELTANQQALAAAVRRERAAWSTYYDALDQLEAGLAQGDGWAVKASQRALGIIGPTLLE